MYSEKLSTFCQRRAEIYEHSEAVIKSIYKEEQIKKLSVVIEKIISLTIGFKTLINLRRRPLEINPFSITPKYIDLGMIHKDQPWMVHKKQK